MEKKAALSAKVAEYTKRAEELKCALQPQKVVAVPDVTDSPPASLSDLGQCFHFLF